MRGSRRQDRRRVGPIVQPGLGHRPFKAVTRVQIPLGSPRWGGGGPSASSGRPCWLLSEPDCGTPLLASDPPAPHRAPRRDGYGACSRPRVYDPRMPPDATDVTHFLSAAASGDQSATNALLPLVYDQLRKVAQRRLDGERSGHTLSSTALVHEAYLKLVGPREIPWAGRSHFYAAAAEAMRCILLDHARARGRRGGEKLRLSEVGDVAALAGTGADEILAVDEAIGRLEGEDPQAGALVRLRFYAGLDVEDAAKALGVSARTAARLWTYARAVLYRDLSDRPESDLP